jgi:hypothetical protein
MSDYTNTKIYKIYSHLGPKIYIGTTTKIYLSQRMSKHRSDYKAWQTNNKRSHIRSYLLFDEYGVDNCMIELIEARPCKSKDEAHKIESHYIRSLDCVNHVNRFTSEELRACSKAYQKAYQKAYRKVNKAIQNKQQQIYQHSIKLKKLDIEYKNIVEAFNKAYEKCV